MATVKLTIDGKQVEVEKGATVLQAAKKAGVDIPTICAHEALPDYGACRMCIVQIEGVRGFPTSCTTPAQDGMVVTTTNEEIEKLRKHVLELMLSGHPNACLTCDDREMCEKLRPAPTKAGRSTRCAFCSNRDHCELREMSLEKVSNELDLPNLYSLKNVERDDPFMDRDYNLCILCGRCWRICEKIHGKPAISIVNRGKEARIATSFHKSHVYSGCVFCGACIDICPTGALSDRYARWHGQHEQEVQTTCLICPQGCSMWSMITRDRRIVANRMIAFNPEDRLCAIGRFAYPQIVNAADRLKRPMIKDNEQQIYADYDEAVKKTAKLLEDYKDGAFLAIVGEAETRETKNMYERFTKELMKGKLACLPAAGGTEDLPEDIKKEIEDEKIKAVMSAGDFLDEKTIEKIERLVVTDILPSPAALAADALFPVAILSEVEGTFRNADNEIKTVAAATDPPGQAQPEWMILRDLAKAMGRDKGFDESSARTITPDVSGDQAPKPIKGSPRDNLQDLPARYRGHYIADMVCALDAMGMPTTVTETEAEGPDQGFLVVEKQEIIPNFHLLEVEAPPVARFAKPGQFVILMVKETSERVPFTIVDWDPEKGVITLIIEEVGRSSREVARLRKGERIAHVAGPLGLPHPIEKLGTVALGGGCYGIGAIYPIARALKRAGNRVISVIEAASDYLLYMEDKIKEVSDEVIIVTKDGSKGEKSSVPKVFARMIQDREKVDAFIAIGCAFMMKMAADATRDSGIQTHVALNPIMVDGTGMCGACRVSVAGDTRFACVDGPMFNAHEVDWDELFSRKAAYALPEIEALPQKACAHKHAHGGECRS